MQLYFIYLCYKLYNIYYFLLYECRDSKNNVRDSKAKKKKMLTT